MPGRLGAEGQRLPAIRLYSRRCHCACSSSSWNPACAAPIITSGSVWKKVPSLHKHTSRHFERQVLAHGHRSRDLVLGFHILQPRSTRSSRLTSLLRVDIPQHSPLRLWISRVPTATSLCGIRYKSATLHQRSTAGYLTQAKLPRARERADLDLRQQRAK